MTNSTPEAIELFIDGEKMRCQHFWYFILNKPTGLLSATEDFRQKTVLDLFPNELRRLGLFPVGRLDKDTTGLLLITNDGKFSHRITSPRCKIPKLYRVKADSDFNESDILAFSSGIVLLDGTRCSALQN